MFKKVLISDDYSSINQGVVAVLEQSGITQVQQVQYCDDAYLAIKGAIKEEDPYDLLITDLNFKTDHRKQKYPTGESLASQLRLEYPELKIIVYSVDDRLQKVRYLVNRVQVNAFVCKGRDGLIELNKAIEAVYEDQLFLSPQVQQALQPRNDLEIRDYDIELLLALSQGLSKEAISKKFKEKGITPSSLSAVEKKQKSLLIRFRANNPAHLVAIVKDLGLI